MSTHRKSYRIGTEYDSDTSYQEYSDDDYIESGDYTAYEYPDGQDYAYSDYTYPDSQGYQDYEYPDGQDYQDYGYQGPQDESGYSDQDYGYQEPQDESGYSYQDYGYQEPQDESGYSYQDYGYQESQAEPDYGYQDYGFPDSQDESDYSYQNYGYQAPQVKNYSYRRPQVKNYSHQEPQTEQDNTLEKPDGQEDEQEYLRRQQSRQHRRIREEKRRKRRRRLKIIRAALIGGMLLILALIIFIIRLIFFSNPVERKVKVEAGTELKVKDFLKKDKVKAEFVTDVTKVSLDHVGEQEIVLKVKGKERKSRLIVQDTVAPKAKASDAVVDIDGELKAKDLVKDIKDATDVTCSFKEKPDLSKEGTVSATVILKDEGGNTAEVTADVKVIVDTEAPVIDGVAPLTGFIGEPISYKSTITVTDNCTKNREVAVDNSQVDTKTEGTYDVFYSAVDHAGNETEASTTITIKEKPENYVTPEEALKEADEVLKEITTKDMTLKEKARAIYNWARTEIGYVNTSDKDSWTNGAHQGFTEKSGDCFVYFAASKALLTEAGIPNLDVVKSDTSESSHYWSLIDCGDGWYHFDTTPRYGGGDDFFMKTDDEILKYSRNHGNSHIFDQSLYPATPTEASTIE